MKKKSLYLHIGTEKTGTTSIQSFMFANQVKLQEHGVLYPKTFKLSNHVPICVAFQDVNLNSELYSVVGAGLTEESIRDYKIEMLNSLEKEILASDCEVVVISNEHLHSRFTNTDEIKRLYDWCSKLFEKITLVCYIRKQSDLALSYFSTLIKTGNAPENVFPKFEKIPHYYDYKKLLDNWSGVFGNVECSVFSKKTLFKGDVVTDFLNKIDMFQFRESFNDVAVSNQSLDNNSLFLLKELNKDFPLIVNGKFNLERRHLVELFELSSMNNSFKPSGVEYDEFQIKFHEQNLYISENYFDGETLFSENKNMKATGGEPSFQDVAETFSLFWKEASKKILFMERRNLYLKAELADRDGNIALVKEYFNQMKALGPLLPKAQELLLKFNNR